MADAGQTANDLTDGSPFACSSAKQKDFTDFYDDHNEILNSSFGEPCFGNYESQNTMNPLRIDHQPQAIEAPSFLELATSAQEETTVEVKEVELTNEEKQERLNSFGIKKVAAKKMKQDNVSVSCLTVRGGANSKTNTPLVLRKEQIRMKARPGQREGATTTVRQRQPQASFANNNRVANSYGAYGGQNTLRAQTNTPFPTSKPQAKPVFE